ncbi:hypothetical protein [Methanobrevibacter arboriphilus]|uniref:hypothetical protein n=1 Tax=Methanobrevibacter arboriphilus TaxID=39441 RepID=UPI0009B56EF9|nr:hypothetical protein [Methanobrevibacter arboriphilus]
MSVKVTVKVYINCKHLQKCFSFIHHFITYQKHIYNTGGDYKMMNFNLIFATTIIYAIFLVGWIFLKHSFNQRVSY